ncbi:MAG TPA: HlyD family secretion protein [Noviherbaspirillum sp.]|jgi:membrane fusion protein (multidrug efflux system)|uniref:HlyD family secretion protein n=1 Tax=Noviherbaspirillum sp. TaxID=1926288 RepID=UPI002F935D56
MNQNNLRAVEADATTEEQLSSQSTSVNDPGGAAGKRKKMFAALAAAVVLAGAGYGTYWHLVASHYVSTENAYVAAETVQITPAISGTVNEVRVTDTQQVKKGDVLVVIDDTDAKLSLAQAQAELARAERRVQGYLATDQGLQAQIAAREADQKRAAAQLASAQADLARAKLDLSRREALAKSGSVSGEELSNARTAMSTAEANLRTATAAVAQADANRAAAIGSLKANATLTANTTVQTNPEVAAARARVEQAQVDLSRTVLRAPVDGVIAKRQAQVGQRVQPGAQLLAVVPIQEAHVDANFKEVQLKDVAVGQPVELEADLYGNKVKYHGVVAGFAGGTGSAFAVIPSQNATGNWLKVVQRVPVRIALNPEELKAHPLRVGLSMTATIDTAAAPRQQVASN